jgi:hypothetical protein
MLKIAIPKPCHEDWDKMLSNQHGRHCNACAKTVTDFTTMTDEAIKDFFINKKEEPVCGKFKNEQLSRIIIDLPENILYIDMPLWKKFLAACLIVFSTSLFSCDTTIDGKQPLTEQIKTDSAAKTLVDPSKGMVGGLLIRWDSTICTQITLPVNLGATYGLSVIIAADTAQIGTPAIIEQDSIPAPVIADSISNMQQNLPDSNMILKPDSLKIKNPPKADSINCDDQIFTKL